MADPTPFAEEDPVADLLKLLDLERIELNATAASVTFANIPQTGYTDLKVVVSARLDVNDVQLKMYFNADTKSLIDSAAV
jgi:hypothetical protein